MKLKTLILLKFLVAFGYLATGVLLAFQDSRLLIIYAVSSLISVEIMLSFEIRQIPACDGGVYLTRITLLRLFGGKLMINVFRKSDEREMHDHPWNFWSLIIWRGYIETRYLAPNSYINNERFSITRTRRTWPGQILRRRTWDVHRVELLRGKPAVSLVWRGPHKRVWGFHTAEGWLDHVAWWRKNCDHNKDGGPYISKSDQTYGIK